MTNPIRTLIAAAALAAVAATALAAPPPARWTGVWRNASNSVHIRAAPCGRGMCGTVVWASPKAKADVAARGGRLIGAQLFRDFRWQDDGRWHGTVYVPDIDKSFTGTITVDNATTITGEGCLFRSIGCRAQVWKRVK